MVIIDNFSGYITSYFISIKSKEMNRFTKLIRDLLADRIEAIDAGNSHIDEETAVSILKAITDSTDMTKRVSKYKACQILCISRATFDNYVREGKLPQGEHTIGFKEKSWSMKDINDFKTKYWNK